MATQSVEFSAPSGQTVTARLFSAGNDTVVQTASAVTEATNRDGVYTATFTDAAAGAYRLIATNSGGTLLAQWWVDLTLTTATFQSYEMPVSVVQSGLSTLDAAGVRTAIGMASANLDTQLSDIPTVAEFEARTILASAYFDPAVDAVANVTTVGSVTGSVTVGTNNDKTGYSLATTPPTAAAIADAVWDEATAGHTTADTYGGRIVRSTNSNVGVQITGSNHIAADVHEFQADVLTSNATAASFVTEVQSGLATAANQTTILNRLGSWTGSGLNTILGAFRAIAGKAASLTPTDLSSGTTYDNTTDSLEAIRDRGDAAWAPGEAGSGDASQSTLLDVQDQVEAIAAALGGSSVSVTNRVADGGAMTLYTGDDMRVRSGTSITVAISDVAGGIYTRLSGIGVANLAWGAARQSQAAGAISGTISSVTQSGAGSAQVVNLVIEINDAGQSLNPADDYVWQVVSTSSNDDEYTEIEGTLDLRRRVAVPV